MIKGGISKKFVEGLVPGDALTFSVNVKDSEIVTKYAVLLRCEEDLFYFSKIADRLTDQPSRYNPFRFDEVNGVFLDKDGDIF